MNLQKGTSATSPTLPRIDLRFETELRETVQWWCTFILRHSLRGSSSVFSERTSHPSTKSFINLLVMYPTMNPVKMCTLNRILVNSSRLGLGQNYIPSRLSTTAAASNVTKTNREEVIRRKDPLDLSFGNAEAAFRSKTSLEILRAYVVFSLCSSNYLVENNLKVNWMTLLQMRKFIKLQ